MKRYTEFLIGLIFFIFLIEQPVLAEWQFLEKNQYGGIPPIP
jgi:hypothetical protein